MEEQLERQKSLLIGFFEKNYLKYTKLYLIRCNHAVIQLMKNAIIDTNTSRRREIYEVEKKNIQS